MTSTRILTVSFSVAASALVFAQGEPRLPAGAETTPALSVQAPLNPGYGLLTATCKTPPPGRGGRGPGGNRGGGGRAAAPAGVRDYTVAAIPGVVNAGAKWKYIWQQAGNNGDGIVGLTDGSLLLAQNDSSDVLKLTTDGKTSVAYANTRTGGALSLSAKGGRTFIVERGLHQRIEDRKSTRLNSSH